MRFLQGCVGPRLRGESILALAHETAANCLEPPLPDDAIELAQLLRAQMIATRTHEDLLLLQASGSALLVRLDLLEGHFPAEGSALTVSLMSGGEPSTTAAQGHELLRLARTAAADPEVPEWLRSPQRDGREWRRRLSRGSSFGLSFESFLRRYGHRAVYESYFHHPRWREDPSFILDAVVSLIDCCTGPGHGRNYDGDAARERVRRQLPVWHRPVVPLAVKLAMAERNMREGARSALTAQSGVTRRLALALAERWVGEGRLSSADDVFHLTWFELLAVAEGRLAAHHARRRIVLRRRQFEAFASEEAPDLIIESGNATSPSPVTPTLTPSASQWQGVVVASRSARGTAMLAHHPSEALNLAAGSVLVAPATDPSWTPAFLKASAIVTETGGYLSHGAIVARELGIPAVANVSGIGVISLGSGCVSDWTVCACQGEGTGEAQQPWRLQDAFQPGEILIADRTYSSYFLLAALQQRGIDFVIREHARRKNDPARTRVLGPNESVITWDRPKQPDWMDDADYAALPQTLSVREVRGGNRLLVTSLCDIQQASAEEIGWLYTQRWQIELDFRAIKCVMQMDILRCKTPDMVCKEIAAHWLGYNLIRAVMGEAAKPEGLPLRSLSFAAARRASAQFQQNLRQVVTDARRAQAHFLISNKLQPVSSAETECP